MVETPKECPKMVQMTHLGEGRLNFGTQCPVEERSMVLRDSIQFHQKLRVSLRLTSLHSGTQVHQREDSLPMIWGQIPCMPMMLQILQVPRICVSMDQIWVFMPTYASCYRVSYRVSAKKWPTFSWQCMSTCWGTLWSTGYAGTLMKSCQCIYCENLKLR